jgi:hypothetical protein
VSTDVNAPLYPASVLRAGGAFSSRMEAKDGSMGFDFAGTYTRVVEHQLIENSFGGRMLLVEFVSGPDGVTVRETFDAESTHHLDQQRQGWQAILEALPLGSPPRALPLGPFIFAAPRSPPLIPHQFSKGLAL